jgi:hypothetical protein
MLICGIGICGVPACGAGPPFVADIFVSGLERTGFAAWLTQGTGSNNGGGAGSDRQLSTIHTGFRRLYLTLILADLPKSVSPRAASIVGAAGLIV